MGNPQWWNDIFGASYEQVGQGAGDYSSYDPGNFMQMMQQYLGGQAGQQARAPQQSQYGANAWLGDMGVIQQMIGGAVGQYGAALNQGSGEMARRAMESVSSQYAGTGRSGARSAAESAGAAQVFGDIQKQIAGMGVGMLGQGMGIASGNRQYGDTSQLNWAGLGQQGQNNYLQALLGAGNTWSTLVAPTYGAQEGWGSTVLDAGLSIGTMIAGLQ